MRDDGPTARMLTRRAAVPLLLVALFLLVAQYWIAAGAAVLGGLIALAGGWLTGRREHASWLRDQRATRYQELVTRSNQLQMAHIPIFGPHGLQGGTPPSLGVVMAFLDVGEGGSVADTYAKMLRAVLDAASSVEVIGPENVADAARALQSALLEPIGGGDRDIEPDAVHKAEKAFLQAARVALRTR